MLRLLDALAVAATLRVTLPLVTRMFLWDLHRLRLAVMPAKMY